MEKIIEILECYKNGEIDLDGAINTLKKLNENNELFYREDVIKIVNRAFFFLSDNGDEDMTGRDYMDMYFKIK